MELYPAVGFLTFAAVDRLRLLLVNGKWLEWLKTNGGGRERGRNI